MSDVIAMLRGGSGGGSIGPPGPQGPQGIPGVNGATWYSGTTNPVIVVGAVNGDYYLNTATGDIFKLMTAIWTLQGNIMGPAGPGSDVLVYQWVNSFDPTAGSGVAVPAGKAAFGWCAETSPGAGDGTLWIYTGPTPKKWAPCAFIFNLAQNWANILGVSIAYYSSPANGMPVISYNNALIVDGPEIDIAIDPGILSFKIHLRAMINGTDPGDHATIQGIVNGITTPDRQTLSGESTSALASDQICSIHTIGPMGSGVTGAKPGDFVDVTIESYYPATNNTPQVVRFTSVVVRASGEMITNVAALAIPPTNPVTAVASVGIKLFDDSETLTLTFDHTQATVALLQNGY